MKKLLFYSFVLLLACCNNKEQQEKELAIWTKENNRKYDSLRKILDSIEVIKEDSLINYFVKFSKTVEENPLKIILYGEKNGKDLVIGKELKILKNNEELQTFKIDSSECFEYELQVGFFDANFDGKKDVYLTKEKGMNWYRFNVWINNDGKFIRNKKLEEIVSPEIDSINKVINSNYRSGSEHFSKIYKWKKGKLVKISESYYDEEHPE